MILYEPGDDVGMVAVDRFVYQGRATAILRDRQLLLRLLGDDPLRFGQRAARHRVVHLRDLHLEEERSYVFENLRAMNGESLTK